MNYDLQKENKHLIEEICTLECDLHQFREEYGDRDEDYEMFGIEMLTIEISMYILAFLVHKSVEDSRIP